MIESKKHGYYTSNCTITKHPVTWEYRGSNAICIKSTDQNWKPGDILRSFHSLKPPLLEFYLHLKEIEFKHLYGKLKDYNWRLYYSEENTWVIQV